MASKDVRKLIITLVILAIGIKLITAVAGSFTSGTTLPAVRGVSSGLSSISDLTIIGITFLIIILIPVYLSKRSKEKKYGVSK